LANSSTPISSGRLRPIVARLRRAFGREYGRPEESDLRSFWVLSTNVWASSATQIGGFIDIGGVSEDPAQSEPFFTERTLAAYLAVSDRTIRNWIRCGELPSYKLGAARRIDPADVEDFLVRHRDEAS
jgi:excisionase family DNA binding protein